MTIATTGQLRSFLAQTIEDVKSGSIDLDKAARITKLAAQINESFYAEVKIAQVAADLMRPDLSEKALGQLPLHGTDDEVD